MRTNCDNCGGVLIDGKCPYCGAVWFRPGVTIGEHAYITEASITAHDLSIDEGRDEHGRMHMTKCGTEYEVELSIIGLTQEEVRKLVESIHGGLSFKSKDC